MSPDKPIGSYLFAGPTGVGKTEVARQLASSLGVELLRFDMSEYMERHTVSRLIGAPPGYVGFDQGGLLTDGIDQHPHCVLLLDEIEKAHPDLFNILLQVMDHGKLTDHNGKQIDFRNVILIMTSNAGAADMAKQAYGFTRTRREGDDTEAINKLFTPEFRNRLDAVISFGALPRETIYRVVDKFVMQLEAQLADRNVMIELSDEARDWLVERGYDPTMGARPMGRVIQQAIKTPLADIVLFGKLKGGGAVRVIVAEDENGETKLDFEFPEGPLKPRKENLPKPKKPRRKRASPRKTARKSGPKPDDKPGGDGGGGVRTVPKVPFGARMSSSSDQRRPAQPAPDASYQPRSQPQAQHPAQYPGQVRPAARQQQPAPPPPAGSNRQGADIPAAAPPPLGDPQLRPHDPHSGLHHPAYDPRYGAIDNAVDTPHRPSPGPDYVPVDPVMRQYQEPAIGAAPYGWDARQTARARAAGAVSASPHRSRSDDADRAGAPSARHRRPRRSRGGSCRFRRAGAQPRSLGRRCGGGLCRKRDAASAGMACGTPGAPGSGHRKQPRWHRLRNMPIRLRSPGRGSPATRRS